MHPLTRPAILAVALPGRVPRLPRPRSYTASPSPAPSSPSPDVPTLNPRWLTTLNPRLGKCLTFGLSPPQLAEACSILQDTTANWRDLVAGSEGFLTGEGRWGLFRQRVVWGEMGGWDAGCYGHVNNVTYNRWAESSRVNWAFNFAAMDAGHRDAWKALMTPTGIGMILRSIRTDYKFPIKYPDRVTVLHKLRSRPNADTDHFILDVLILSELHRRIAARCVEDIVIYDYKATRKSSMQPFMVDKLQETFELQEQAKVKYGNKAHDLIRRVRELEKSSWDKADAKEDFGSANR